MVKSTLVLKRKVKKNPLCFVVGCGFSMFPCIGTAVSSHNLQLPVTAVNRYSCKHLRASRSSFPCFYFDEALRFDWQLGLYESD